MIVHSDICIPSWIESACAPIGVYYRIQNLKVRDSLTGAFLKTAECLSPYLVPSGNK